MLIFVVSLYVSTKPTSQGSTWYPLNRKQQVASELIVHVFTLIGTAPQDNKKEKRKSEKDFHHLYSVDKTKKIKTLHIVIIKKCDFYCCSKNIINLGSKPFLTRFIYNQNKPGVRFLNVYSALREHKYIFKTNLQKMNTSMQWDHKYIFKPYLITITIS